MSTNAAPVFTRLVRFEDEDGKEQWGDLTEASGHGKLTGTKADVLVGSLEDGFTRSGKTKMVTKLLAPALASKSIICIGLNYKQHAEEAKLQIPKHPVVFVKPPDALAGPYDNIHIHPEVQQQLDYEGELTVVIGRDAKNVTAAQALDYVLGYTVGNDLSARDFQIPASVCGGQFCYAKSFDQFAPIGPCIVSTTVVPDPQKLHYYTKVNGQMRQQTSTSDMVWTIAQIIEHLSRGTTLRAGSLIMTGTPSGVGLFMQPQQFLKNGDVVEIGIEGCGGACFSINPGIQFRAQSNHHIAQTRTSFQYLGLSGADRADRH